MLLTWTFLNTLGSSLPEVRLISDNMVVGAIACEAPCILCLLEAGYESELVGGCVECSRTRGVLRNSKLRQFKSK